MYYEKLVRGADQAASRTTAERQRPPSISPATEARSSRATSVRRAPTLLIVGGGDHQYSCSAARPGAASLPKRAGARARCHVPLRPGAGKVIDNEATGESASVSGGCSGPTASRTSRPSLWPRMEVPESQIVEAPESQIAHRSLRTPQAGGPGGLARGVATKVGDHRRAARVPHRRTPHRPSGRA